MALELGIIPLRPLTLSDIFNGAIRYIRANPKTTLGLTAVVVIVTQVIALLVQIGPLAATGQLDALRGGASDSTEAADTFGRLFVRRCPHAGPGRDNPDVEC